MDNTPAVQLPAGKPMPKSQQDQVILVIAILISFWAGGAWKETNLQAEALNKVCFAEAKAAGQDFGPKDSFACQVWQGRRDGQIK